MRRRWKRSPAGAVLAVRDIAMDQYLQIPFKICRGDEHPYIPAIVVFTMATGF
jgi:hypothetical protein